MNILYPIQNNIYYATKSQLRPKWLQLHNYLKSKEKDIMIQQTIKTLTLLSAIGTLPLLACNGSHVLGTGGSGAVYTMSANTLQEGGFYLGLNAERISNHTLKDNTILKALQNGSTHLHNIDAINAYSLSLSYGIRDDLTLNMQVPYISRVGIRAGEMIDGIPEVHPHADSEGLSDISAILQYKVYDKEQIKIALLAGVKAPTGKTNIQEEDEALEADLQPGTGSWDFFAGVASTKDFERLSLHSSLLYKYNTKGVEDSQLGDVFNYNVALAYKLIEQEHNHTFHAHKEEESLDYSVDIFLELNGEWVDKDQFNGVIAENTGHHVLFATTGVQVLTESNYAIFLTLSVPIYQNFNGLQNEISYKTSFGIGKNF